MSERYITDRYLPDKAIDVIDEAGSRANLKNMALVELTKLEKELDAVLQQKEDAARADSIDDYQKAAELKVERIPAPGVKSTRRKKRATMSRLQSMILRA